MRGRGDNHDAGVADVEPSRAMVHADDGRRPRLMRLPPRSAKTPSMPAARTLRIRGTSRRDRGCGRAPGRRSSPWRRPVPPWRPAPPPSPRRATTPRPSPQTVDAPSLKVYDARFETTYSRDGDVPCWRQKWSSGAVAAADRKAMRDRARDKVRPCGRRPSGSVWPSARLAVSAAANVQPVPCGMPGLLAWMTELVEIAAVVQQVDDVGVLEVAALHDRRPRPEIDQRLRRVSRIVAGRRRRGP